MTLAITSARLMLALPRCGLAAVVLFGAQGALAQAPGDRAAAATLYEEGRALVKAERNAEGCAKFEASLSLFPAASTMINIANCHEHDGKLATAWADYARALDLNRDTAGEERRRELEALAQGGMRALAPRLPRLRIELTNPPPGVQVSRDGGAIPIAALGTALPADPGPHTVRVSAPGYREEARSVTLQEGKTETIALALQPAEARAESRPGWSLPVGITLGALGVLGLGAGAVTGGISLGQVSSIKSHAQCVSGSPCSTTDADGVSSAKTLGNVSTAAFIAGGVLAAAGVTVLVLGRGGERKPTRAGGQTTSSPDLVRVAVRPGRIELQGSF